MNRHGFYKVIFEDPSMFSLMSVEQEINQRKIPPSFLFLLAK